MSEQTKTVFLHVGCRKSGTTSLQLGLRRAAKKLRGLGLEQPLGARGGTMSGLRDPLLRMVNEGDEAAGRSAVADLATRIRTSPVPRHLVTLEALAEMPREATSVVVEGLAEFDTHLVVTARPWALTIPSEWQQLVKSRFTGAYADFARAVRDPGSVDGEMAQEALRFRQRQDVADVVRRWRAGSAQLPVHVILVPARRDTEPTLADLFCRVVGIDPALIAVSDRIVNPSISHEDAEVLRLVNSALGDRLQNTRRNYRYSVRKWIAVGTMMKGSPGSRIRLPAELEAWASEESARQLDELPSERCEVLGDPEDFLHPPLQGEDFVPATDAEVARAAAEVLADLAQRHNSQRRKERRRSRQRARRRRARRRAQRADATSPSTAGRARTLARGLARRVRARR